MEADKGRSERREQKKAQNTFWLQNQLNDIVEPMMVELIQSKPEDTIGFMLKHLEAKYGERATVGDKSHLMFLRNETDRLEKEVKELRAKQAADHKSDEDKGSEHETDESDEDDYVDELPEDIIAKRKARGPRASVSAEVFGVYNKKEAFVPPVIEKSNEAKEAIMSKIESTFMFSGLEESEKDIVVNAMAEKHFKSNDVVIKEGEQGECLYVVATGNLKCTKVLKGTEPTFLKEYHPGEAFGELALLYNAPRAATITALGDCLLYELDRQTFNHIVKDSAVRRREKYENFLSKIPILETVDAYERSQIAEAFKDAKYKAGEKIIKEGDEGRELFFLLSGKAHAVKVLNAGADAQRVCDYDVGSYFGELALLRNEPRAATIIAETDCSCVTMDRHAFKRMLGPLEDILKRNIDLYAKFKKDD